MESHAASAKQRPPAASRPSPRSYFLPEDQGPGLLSWSDARQRLIGARNYWVTTADAAGAPHAMPVWGVWLEDCFLFSTSPSSRKARNLADNPRVVVHLESGAQLVVVEGIAREVAEPGVVAAFLAAYNPKYAWSLTPADVRSGLFEVRPRKAFAWLGDQGEAFSGTATRWRFEA
jgi:Pyridoxamine 5'-phosphate oxidase